MGRKKLTAGRDPNLPFICYVCGDTARGNNFSVLSCVSCKSFFRRHGLMKPDKLRCKHQNDCTVNKETRGTCLPCRLKKCLAVGMDPQMIRCPPSNHSQNHQRRQQQQQQQSDHLHDKLKSLSIATPRRLDLLDFNDRSTLTTDQWTLLSNVINCYDGQNLVGHVRSMLEEKSSLPVKLRSKALDTLNLISEPLRSLHLLLQMTPHYRHLSSNAQNLLQANNIFFTSAVSGYLVAREVRAFQNATYMTACSALYGEDYMLKCAQDSLRLEPNGNLVKLILFVLIFSSNCSVVVYNRDQFHQYVTLYKSKFFKSRLSTSELLNLQDVYVTMLWKYLVYLYGYNQAAIRFASMVKSILDMFSRVEELPTNPTEDQVLTRVSRDIDGSSMSA